MEAWAEDKATNSPQTYDEWLLSLLITEAQRKMPWPARWWLSGWISIQLWHSRNRVLEEPKFPIRDQGGSTEDLTDGDRWSINKVILTTPSGTQINWGAADYTPAAEEEGRQPHSRQLVARQNDLERLCVMTDTGKLQQQSKNNAYNCIRGRSQVTE